MKKNFTAIVVPTIREDCIKKFLKEWGDAFKNCAIYIIEDNKEVSFDLPSLSNVEHFSWKGIDAELGNDSWIIPRKSDCIRSYGYYRAWKDGAKYIITLDDDCYPGGETVKYRFVQDHIDNLERTSSPYALSPWTSTIDGLKPRGVPFNDTVRLMDTKISHGLWLENPDLDAVTQLSAKHLEGHWEDSYSPILQYIPRGNYYPMCGMNLAWKVEITPIMYFLLMGKLSGPYDRFGDIWSGIFSKKILDHLDMDVFSGTPMVVHKKASDPMVNLDKEYPGYRVNEILWNHISMLRFKHHTYEECYLELADYLTSMFDARLSEYWIKLRDAMRIWIRLFK